MTFGWMKRLLILASVAPLMLCLMLPRGAWGGEQPVFAPVSPEFTAYINDMAMGRLQDATDGLHPLGLIPSPLDLSHLRGLQYPMAYPMARAMVGFPVSYDLRAQGKLTPIRDQSSCGDCWAFGAMGSLESSLMPAESRNFSENNLKNTHGFDWGCCSGGNREIATAYFARWSGPVEETSDPYNPGSCSSPTGLSPAKHVQDIIYVPDRGGPLDNDNIKQAVMTYGDVYTTMLWTSGAYNPSTYAFYYGGASYANHAVGIVGWDDNFPASRFLTPPPGNGAFLIRNSWGTWWGNGGYFWISYYDHIVGSSNAVYLAEPSTNYSSIYQYDPLGCVSNTGYGSSTAWFANVFTATKSESVGAASWFSASPGSSYEVRVYTDPANGPLNAGGPATSQTGTIATVGYHTVPLSTPVPVAAGQRFSVVVKLTTPGYSYPIPVERPYSGYASAARASAGQSYISSTGATWSDITSSNANSNVCLKAFTVGNGGGPAPTPNPAIAVSPASMDFGSVTVGTPATRTLTVSNTGSADLSVSGIASGNAAITATPTSFTVSAGQSQSVTVRCAPTAAGAISASLTVSSNDPATPSKSVPVTATAVAASANPTISLNPTSLAFGTVTVGAPITKTLTVSNTGAGVLNVTGIASSNAAITASPAAFSVDAGFSQAVSVRCAPTAAGTISAILTIPSNDSSSPSKTVPVTATAVAAPSGNPAISLTPGSFTRTLAPGGIAQDTLTIGNTGVAALSFAADVIYPGNTGSGYQWKSSQMVGGPAFNWVDATIGGKQVLGLMDDNSVGPFPIGFDFPFYGTPSQQFYIGSNGIIGFGPTTGYSSPTNSPLPSPSAPNNMICWLWDNLKPQRDSMIYYKNTTAGLVIEFMNYGSALAPNARIIAEVILKPTGEIMIQYRSITTDWPANRGTIGIEDATGTAAAQVAYNKSYARGYMAICFTPPSGPAQNWLSVAPTTGTVAAGGSAPLTLNYNAAGLTAGSYSATVRVQSNDPARPSVLIPVSLGVGAVAGPGNGGGIRIRR